MTMRSVCLLLLPCFAFAGVIWDDVIVKVNGFEWKREVEVEVQKAVKETDWCSEVPAAKTHILDVNYVSKRKRSVEKKKLPDGKVYSYDEVIDWYAPEKRLADDGKAYTAKEFQDYYGKRDNAGSKQWIKAKQFTDQKARSLADQKWGAGVEQNCSLIDCYVEEFDYKCEYTIDQWVYLKTEQTFGNDQSPYWPTNILPSGSPCDELDCQRTGANRTTFRADVSTMVRRSPYSETTCGERDMDIAQWQELKLGKEYPAYRYSLTGLDCKSIKVDDYVDATSSFGASEVATVADVGVKCCCLKGWNSNICQLANTVPENKMSPWDVNGCGALVNKGWHSFTNKKDQLHDARCIIPKAQAMEMKIQYKDEL